MGTVQRLILLRKEAKTPFGLEIVSKRGPHEEATSAIDKVQRRGAFHGPNSI